MGEGEILSEREREGDRGGAVTEMRRGGERERGNIKRERLGKKRKGRKRQEMKEEGEIYVLGSVQRSNACVCCQINMSCRRTSCHVKSLLSPSLSVSTVLLHAPLHTPNYTLLGLYIQAAPSLQRQRKDFKH